MAAGGVNYMALTTFWSIFDALCSERERYPYHADPRLQLHFLTHTNMTVFRKCHIDNGIAQQFWIDTLPKFSKLVVLDLRFICTDDILQIVGISCPLLEEINIVSKVDIGKSSFNATMLIKYVSDVGLRHITNLKHLRILTMDHPKNEQHQYKNRQRRFVSQAGIIMLVSELPYLEELRIDSCDIGSTLIGSENKIGPLSLRKVNWVNNQNSPEDGVLKVLKLCPFLKEFSVTEMSKNSSLNLDEISLSELRLTKLELIFFSYTQSMQQLLMLKGKYLTNFSLWEKVSFLNLNSLLDIGTYCPNLTTLCLMTDSKNLVIPQTFKHKRRMFTELRKLVLGNNYFDIGQLLTFFLGCTENLQKLILKYRTKTNIDEVMIRLVEKGQLQHVSVLWLDCSLVVSKIVVQQIIQECRELQMFAVEFVEDMSEVERYICENNLDLKLDSTYSIDVDYY